MLKVHILAIGRLEQLTPGPFLVVTHMTPLQFEVTLYLIESGQIEFTSVQRIVISVMFTFDTMTPLGP